MTVEFAIWTRLTSLAPVTALASTRVYLEKLPQSVRYPAVRVQLISDPQTQHLRGPEGLRSARVQVDHYAAEASGVDPYASASALSDATEGDGAGPDATGLSGFIGSIGSPALEILNCRPVLRTRDYDPDELRLVTMRTDYDVEYRA